MTDKPTPQVTYTLKIKENKHLSDNRFLLKIEKPQNFQYLPGQFAILAEQRGKDLIQRPYSIASIPHEPFLLFFIRKVDDGALTPILYNKRPGDTVLMSGPYGHLTHETIGVPDKLVLIAMGSGIAAIRPLAYYYTKFDSVDLTIIHQVKFVDNLVFYNELGDIGKYIPVVSRETKYTVINDSAAHGLVKAEKQGKQFYVGHFPELKALWFSPDASFVIVGKRDRVENLFDILTKWGADASRMYTEKY